MASDLISQRHRGDVLAHPIHPGQFDSEKDVYRKKLPVYRQSRFFSSIGMADLTSARRPGAL
jgi:hypothetical protein